MLYPMCFNYLCTFIERMSSKIVNSYISISDVAPCIYMGLPNNTNPFAYMQSFYFNKRERNSETNKWLSPHLALLFTTQAIPYEYSLMCDIHLYLPLICPNVHSPTLPPALSLSPSSLHEYTVFLSLKLLCILILTTSLFLPPVVLVVTPARPHCHLTSPHCVAIELF